MGDYHIKPINLTDLTRPADKKKGRSIPREWSTIQRILISNLKKSKKNRKPVWTEEELKGETVLDDRHMYVAIKKVVTDGANAKTTQFFCDAQHTKQSVIGDDTAESYPYIKLARQAWISRYRIVSGQKNQSGVVNFYKNGWIYRCADGKFINPDGVKVFDPLGEQVDK